MTLDRRHLPVAITALLLVALFSLGAAQYSGFGSVRVALNLFTDNAFLAIAAFGMTFVILSGGIDLSVGAVMALSGVLAAVLIERSGWPPPAAFVLILAVGAVFGSLMGMLIDVYRLQPFIVTLAGMFVARGLALVLSEQSVPIDHALYQHVNGFGFPVSSGWVGSAALELVLVLAAALWLAHFTRLGAYIYAIGGNAQSARLMGVPVRATTVGIYALSSALAALAGIFYSFYTASGYALAGIGLELDAIAAVVIGGTLLTGGYGSIVGTLLGVLLMGLVQTYISFNGQLNSWWTKIVIGALVLVFVTLQKLLAAPAAPAAPGPASRPASV
jgi:simple sugar transport system permease protein